MNLYQIYAITKKTIKKKLSPPNTRIVMKKIISTLISIILLSGCAAMFHGTSQQITIRSKNPNSKIYVNEMYLGNGDVVTTFQKNKNYTIRVEEDGCRSVVIPVTKSFDAITLLGVFIDFGIVSVLVVDGAGTGAWKQFDQTSYVVTPQCPAP